MDFFDNANVQYDELNGECLLPSDSGSQVFGAYTNNLFLNQQKVINLTNFFTFAPTSMLTYYWSIVRRNLEWYNGYVWGIHNKGILSSQTASRLCKMATDLTISGGFYFEGTPTAEKFLEAFCRAKDIEGKLNQKVPLLNGIGFMLAKLDVHPNGHLDLNFVQGNRYFAKTDDEKNVLAYYALIKVLTDNVKGEDENELGYYLVEKRYLRGGKTRQKYCIFKGPMIATAPTFGGETDRSKGIPFEQLPNNIQRYITNRFGDGVLDKEYTLPPAFDGNIGAKIVFNSYAATGMDEYTCFSDSTLHNVHAQLYMLDWTETLKQEHKYIAQDFVAMPDTLMAPEIVAGYHSDEVRNIARQLKNVEGFNKRLVKAARTRDPEKSVPFVYQPQLRIKDYNDDINQILSEIAANAQFSPVTLAGHLRHGAEKTATEVTSDENATRLTIENKRKLISSALNPLFQMILRHYGINDSCTMIFKPGSLSNPKIELDIIERKARNGWLDKEAAIMQANPQFTPREARETMNKVAKEGGGMYNGSQEGLDDIL